MDFLQRAELQPDDGTSGIDWEETDCLLCGGGHWNAFVEAPDRTPGGEGLVFAVVRCQDCGLCFTNPRPSLSCMERFYTASYPPHRTRPRRRQWAPWWRRLSGGPLRQQRNEIAWHGAGRLLDFGCGAGSFLLRMQERGWTVTGLDSSADTMAHLREHLGLNVLAGTLPHPQLTPGSFDVVTMWQALEHMHQPLEVLQAARRLLVPGGKIVVAVPNIDSLAFRWFGSAWNGLDLPRHLVHFSPPTLRLMLHRAGFRVGRVRMVRRSGWLRDSARIATDHFTARRPWLRLLRRRATSNLASWLGFLTRQADCMMVTACKR